VQRSSGRMGGKRKSQGGKGRDDVAPKTATPRLLSPTLRCYGTVAGGVDFGRYFVKDRATFDCTLKEIARCTSP
jgi:hypothetical protein